MKSGGNSRHQYFLFKSLSANLFNSSWNESSQEALQLTADIIVKQITLLVAHIAFYSCFVVLKLLLYNDAAAADASLKSYDMTRHTWFSLSHYI